MLELTKNVPTLLEKQVRETKVELRWAGNFDCDVYAFVLRDGKLIDESLCYFNKLSLFDGAIQHSGDQRNGDVITGDTPDEFMTFKLQEIPTQYNNITVFMSIYNAPATGERFGQMTQMSATILNDGKKIAEINMAENYGDKYGIKVLEFTRENGRWSIVPKQEADYKAIGDYLAVYSAR